MASSSARTVTLALVVGSLLAGVLVNWVVLPGNHVVSSLYAIPILVAAARWQPRGLAVVTVAALVAYGADAAREDRPVEVWPITAATLVTIGALAALLTRQRERLRAGAERVAHLEQVTEAGLAHLALDELLGELLGRVRELLRADTAVILLLEPDGASLRVRAAIGLEEAVERQVRVPVGRGFAGRVVAERRALAFEDARAADLANPVLRERGISALLGAPLLVEGRPIGVIHVDWFVPRRIRPDELRLIQLVADRAAMAIDHARLFEAEHAARLAAEAGVRARDEFLLVAAHELRTPITSLLGFAQLARQQLDADAPLNPLVAERTLGAIDRQSARLAALVARLLDVAHLDTEQLALEPRAADLAAIARGVVAGARMRTRQHTLALDAPDRLIATADAGRIEQVLTNLVENAIKYSPDGGPIDVAVREAPPGWAEVTVRDRGVGIPPERRAHIFDRYYRAHGDEQASGMGLGLYISREIVHRHGGELRAEFPEDGGTRFVVVLPVGVQQSHDGGTPTP